LPVAVAANWLATAWDQNTALPVMSPVAARDQQLARIGWDVQAVICAQAGEVNTGAFDPFPEIVSWARERDAWVHVDGAFGLWALADPSRADLTAGLSAAARRVAGEGA
jgi:cysteine sulfinate desulfinase/cysteine desulfurase-like protein